jgi:hypothetical protein
MGKSNSVKVVALDTSKASVVVNSEPEKALTVASPAPTADSKKMTATVAPVKALPTHVVKVTVSRGTTVTTPTHSGKQSVTVRTNRVKVSVSPAPLTIPSTVDANPILTVASDGTVKLAPGYKFDSQGKIVSINTADAPSTPDWNGYIAPSITWAGWTSCNRVEGNFYGLNGELLTHNWLVTGRIKISGGNYKTSDNKGDITLHSPSEVSYIDYSSYLGFKTLPDSTQNIPVKVTYYLNAVSMNYSQDLGLNDQVRTLAFDKDIPFLDGACN